MPISILAVEEPSGTVCSMDNTFERRRWNVAGRRLPGHGRISSRARFLKPTCAPAASPASIACWFGVCGATFRPGNVSVEILTDAGRPSQRFIRQEVPLTEKDALVVFEVKEGQRKQEVAEAQLAHLA